MKSFVIACVVAVSTTSASPSSSWVKEAESKGADAVSQYFTQGGLSLALSAGIPEKPDRDAIVISSH